METVEEQIENLSGYVDDRMEAGQVSDEALCLCFEIRALRLMLQNEIREAAWPLKQYFLPPELTSREEREEFIAKWEAKRRG